MYCIFFLLFGVEGLDCLQTKFFVHFFYILLNSWYLYLSFLPPLTIFIHQILFWTCYSILFFVCLIRRKVKLNKHTQSTFMHNHVYLWNIEGVLCYMLTLRKINPLMAKILSRGAKIKHDWWELITFCHHYSILIPLPVIIYM